MIILPYCCLSLGSSVLCHLSKSGFLEVMDVVICWLPQPYFLTFSTVNQLRQQGRQSGLRSHLHAPPTSGQPVAVTQHRIFLEISPVRKRPCRKNKTGSRMSNTRTNYCSWSSLHAEVQCWELLEGSSTVLQQFSAGRSHPIMTHKAKVHDE